VKWRKETGGNLHLEVMTPPPTDKERTWQRHMKKGLENQTGVASLFLTEKLHRSGCGGAEIRTKLSAPFAPFQDREPIPQIEF
jgi:hypothetical protein